MSLHDTLLDEVQAATACTAIALLLLDEQGRLRFRAWRGLSKTYCDRVEAFGPIQPDREAPRPLFLQRVDEDETYRVNWDMLRTERIASIAFYPIVSNGVLRGKLAVYYDEDHVPTDEEIAFITERLSRIDP